MSCSSSARGSISHSLAPVASSLAVAARSAAWTSRDARLADFFARDFSERKNKEAALKNAYALLSKHRYLFASAFFGSSTVALVTVMVLRFWISFARIVRGEVLSLREREYVLVARGLGLSTWRILTRHIMPQLISAIGVTCAFCMAAAIVAESTLSFLGVGPSSQSSWGTMLRQGSEQAALGVWHLWLFPAAAIIAVVVRCHVLADRLRSEPAM